MFKKSLMVAVLALMGGCGPFWVNPYITVKESQLNWVEIHYYRHDRKPIKRSSVYLNGMGHVEAKKGTSELVSNDFAKSHKEQEWTDIKTRRVAVDPGHINDIFQHLVNYGLLDNEKYFKKGTRSAKADRFIAVKANINSRSFSEPYNIFEVDAELAEQLLDVVNEFIPPTF